MRALAKEGALRDKTVLLVGKKYDNLKAIAESYGFRKAITIEELHARFPDMYPDSPPAIELDPTSAVNEKDLKVSAVLSMIDPLHWGREAQIMCDVLRSDGSPGTDAPTQTVALHNSCSDFEYAARWPMPRFGAGAFRHALDALWLGLGRPSLDQTLYGKPNSVQYDFVETLLQDLDPDGAAPVERFYMVGDNPLTDLRGANAAGAHWTSILVR